MALVIDAVGDNVLLQKNLNGLQSEDKRKRKSALCDLRKQLFSEPIKGSTLLQDNEDVFKAILRCISDESEACRETAVNILKDLLVENVIGDLNLVLLMPVLSVRLGSEELVESSEEVRHALVELLHVVVKKYSKDLLPYFNDVVIILKKTILDPYPKIKKESCECASSLAFAIPESFHMQSESLIKPLVNILTHQQYRVRVSAILAVGKFCRLNPTCVPILLCCTGKLTIIMYILQVLLFDMETISQSKKSQDHLQRECLIKLLKFVRQ